MPWIELLVALITSLTTLGAVWLAYYLKNRNHVTIEQCVRRDTVIYQILSDIRRKFNFGRVGIMLFHNGSNYYTGEPMQKATATFETVSPGIDPIGPTMRDVPLSTMSYSLSKIMDEGALCIADVDQCDNDHYADLMRAYDEKSHYAFKISNNNDWVGVLIADHCTSQGEVLPLTTAHCEYMSVQAARLSTLLSLSNRSYNIED